jgi:hypothetical protein
MSKALASVVCGCMAALPLIGRAGDVTNARQAGAAPPAAGADVSTYYAGGPRVYAARRSRSSSSYRRSAQKAANMFWPAIRRSGPPRGSMS